MVNISPITLSIDKGLWKRFCSIVPTTRTKNGTIVELIETYVQQKEGESYEKEVSKNN